MQTVYNKLPYVPLLVSRNADQKQSTELTLNLWFKNSDRMESAMSEDITYPGPFA